MDNRERFEDIFKNTIKRAGADKMWEYLTSPASDFFVAPASARFHGAYEGGLAEHSLNVYDCLCDYVERERAKSLYNMNFSEETLAIVSLLHDVCKINCYKPGFRNVKDETGTWIKVPTYEFNDEMPYGHGEKSVYIINGYMRLSREEAFAIRYHMGFSGVEDARSVGQAFEMYPLAFALSVADMEATYYIEGKK
ncbi:MAG: hydrolase [Clostridia bacterium]|nr:hydrolase [Clostridia bacterium]